MILEDMPIGPGRVGEQVKNGSRGMSLPNTDGNGPKSPAN